MTDPEVDEVTAEVPTSPSYREGASIWVWDDAGRFGFPRIGVEAIGRSWTTSFATAACMAWPDGRRLALTGDHPPLPVLDAEGRPRVLGAGPLRFECVEPFAHWRVRYDGPELRLELDARTAAPPWFQGSHEPEGHFVPDEHRFEQLCTVTGEVEVDGTVTPFTGGGLRVHRKGGDRSDYGDFHGHDWQTARFPSGRAFGFIHYRPRPDGSVKYREGWLLDGDELRAARVEGTPWMTDVRPTGEDVSFTLRTATGEVRIEGETFASSFRPPRRTSRGTTFPTLQSGIARYRWGDEEAYGMIERSSPDVTLD